MWMIDTKWMFFRCDIIAQRQIQLIEIPAFPGNRCDRVVRLSVGLGKNKCIRVGVSTPCPEDMICQIDNARFICTLQTNHG